MSSLLLGFLGVVMSNLTPTLDDSTWTVFREVDLRNATDADAAYWVIFCARKSEGGGKPGHAFVVWAEENDRRKLCSSEAFGFYPDEKEKTKGTLGPAKGRVVNEALQPPSSKPELLTHQLRVRVNKNVYLDSKKSISMYKTADYDLFQKNCINFVHEVAVTVGIVARKPKPLELPWDYLAELATKAEASKPK